MPRGARLLLLLAGFALVASTGPLLAPASAQPVEQGQALFDEKCVSCHTIGQGDRVGPDLEGVTTRRDRDWLTRFIATPDQVLAEGDPIAAELLQKYGDVPMPNLGLTGAEVEALITYLESQAGEAPAEEAAEAAAPTLPAGDVAAGKNLFTGADRFENGGAPCLSCHSVAGIGALGGGTLGPDLSEAYTKYGDAGLSSVLASLAFPTMEPVYRGRPLTPREQANLKAFLQQAAAAERPGQAIGRLLLLALGGTAALLALALLVWRRRLTEVRRSLVKGPVPRRR